MRRCRRKRVRGGENEEVEKKREAKVMESLEHAMKRGAPIIAEYLGGAVNYDAYHMTDPRADGLGVSSCIENSLVDAGASPEEATGDLAEINAIKKVFKDTSCIKINATKSMIRHYLGAAEGLEAIATVTVKAINTGWLHPSLNQFESATLFFGNLKLFINTET
ncbi:hypothetical protein QYF36_014835 [Acer negundo]|nr:hypothetical protein QYF36_014835 [Acer negundo]